jgi:hypothetical protein
LLLSSEKENSYFSEEKEAERLLFFRGFMVRFVLPACLPACVVEGVMMAEHKFGVGDRVEVLSHLNTPNLRSGIYTVVRIMPMSSQGRQYRVKNAMDSHEKVLNEAQIRLSAGRT